ncbi:class III lanthionine synthetase LanKC [Streptomyces jumonjinensis]|uniref:Lantipeptide synthetase n=1 Tax=Streptomyces jumonjinensis TaxID=1945 RepID=A0A646KLD4_STRJU|nr:class III lanthionine synthetase LanKC [Streptomyces jumonjinensis]MQT03025.1 lantipeptide synthetase [Streptomyces jumonjinensis]
MNPEYAAYCQADDDFYDTPHRSQRTADDGETLYAPARTPAPQGWETTRHGDWFSYTPLGLKLPPQGWKIHVSAALDNAESVLRRVADYCLPRRIPFKFVPGHALLLLRNSKYGDRAGSGKFITVYPHSDDVFPEVCTDLMALLKGEHGPYVLSDLRCGDGPVYVRYGAFSARFCLGPDGRWVTGIADPSGTLVPDPRGPSFKIPEWVTPPAFLTPHLEARAAVGTQELPYEFLGALHFSNGGGVYTARDTRSGAKAVLKEARPYAGLATDGADAIARLERERTALEQLAGLDLVPRVLGVHDVGDHRFLALEHISGTPLHTLFVRRFPLMSAEPGPERLAEHVAWACRIHGLVEKAVEAVHARGIVFSDLHMSNIMVSDDESRVVLLDFEAASPAAENQRQIVANPAFIAPAGRRGLDIDRYALACLRLALFLPLTTLLLTDRRRVLRLVRDITRIYPVTEDELRPAVEEILRDAPAPGPAEITVPGQRGPGTPVAEDARIPGPRRGLRTPGSAASADPADIPEPGDWPLSRDSMARAILASFTPDRADRCFPGDILQFASPAGGQCLGYGAAGVLHALHETGAPDCPEALEWLLERVKAPVSGTPLGLYDGLSGIAWTLRRLGRPEQALETAQLIIRQPLDGMGHDLHGGHAGIALVLDELAHTADGAEATALRRAADRCVTLAAQALESGPPSVYTGLLRGATGLALLFIRRYESTGDPALLDLAADALRRDLARCKPHTDGALLVIEGKRAMPYLGAGSAGLAMVLDEYLAHRPDAAFDAARQAMQPALRSAFYVQPGLFRGVAGLMLQLARTPVGDPAERQRVIHRHAVLLGVHSLPYAGELAFPGEQSMRRSMDLATGTAGCLLALGSAYGDIPAPLPFLSPRERPTTRPQPGAVHQ